MTKYKSIVRTKIYKCKCNLCGDTFIAKSPKAQYCKKPHMRICPICGKEFAIKCFSRPEITCSKECGHKQANKSRERTFLDKYGVKSMLAAPEIRDKIKQTCKEKYGVENPYQADIVKNRIKQTNFIRYSVDNPAQSTIIQDKIKQTNNDRYGGNAPMSDESVKLKCVQTCISRYGVTNPTKLQLVKDKIAKTCINRYGVDNFSKSDLWRNKVTSTNQQRYGKDFYSQTRDAHIKMSNTRKQCVAYDGTVLEGSYELKVYEYCLTHNITIERQIPVRFIYNDREHTTFIDFKIENRLVECKGGHLLQGCFDYAGHVPIDTKLQIYRDNNALLIVDSIGYNHIKENNKYDLNNVLLIDNIDMLEQMLRV